MAELFTGNYVHKVDSKGRVSVPAAFRAVLAEGDPAVTADQTKPPALYIVKGLDTACLLCYSVQQMQDAIDNILDVEDPDEYQFLQQEFVAQALKVNLDEAGRLVVPHALRDVAGISGEAHLVGQLTSFQIWNPDDYAAHTAVLRARRDELGKRAMQTLSGRRKPRT